jgi:CBS domain-containing protein
MDAHLDLETAGARTVADVMVRKPKTLAASATVTDARRLFENPRVLVALLKDDGRYAGELRRDDLPADADSEQPVGGFAVVGETIEPDRPMVAALELMARVDQERLAVVDAGGGLLGLLCLNRKHGHFCVD